MLWFSLVFPVATNTDFIEWEGVVAIDLCLLQYILIKLLIFIKTQCFRECFVLQDTTINPESCCERVNFPR